MSLASRSDELDKKLQETDIDTAVSTLAIAARRNRRNITLLAFSIGLDFVLTIALTILSVQTNHLANLAQSNTEAVIQNCETANDSRTAQRQLWGCVLSLTPQQPRTAEQQARVDEFAKFVDQTFKQRDCKAEARQQ